MGKRTRELEKTTAVLLTELVIFRRAFLQQQSLSWKGGRDDVRKALIERRVINSIWFGEGGAMALGNFRAE